MSSHAIRIRIGGALCIAALAGLSLTACVDREWCEHDATDTQVDDTYCEQAVPGYEWETAGDDDHHHTRPQPVVVKATPKQPAPTQAAQRKPSSRVPSRSGR
ncbi:hypothetical protein [Nocardia sp. CA-290969]|uniref:hypothetical protein n=1 Tax=Nocardia sp. CA-290969 TaxID=3239986 RepID=UPI003D94D954